MIKSFTTDPRDGKPRIYNPGTIRPETMKETTFRRMAYRDRPEAKPPTPAERKGTLRRLRDWA